jgi:hypothetical protein
MLSSLTSSSNRITDTGPLVLEVGCLRLAAPLRRRGSGRAVGGRGWHGLMKPSPTDIDPLPHRWRNLLPLTGLTAGRGTSSTVQKTGNTTTMPPPRRRHHHSL